MRWCLGGGAHRSTVSFVTTCYDARLMSDHTERLDKIAERLSAAKEFL
jgi:hypothetical protein